MYEVADLREIYAKVYSCARGAVPIKAKAFLFKRTRLGRDG
ncbi:MAG: hypothetical protein WDN24_20230 [Sphingomonas sp.]